MKPIEMQKTTIKDKDGVWEEHYHLYVGDDYLETSLSLDEVADLRDFLTEYINRETKQNHEQE